MPGAGSKTRPTQADPRRRSQVADVPQDLCLRPITELSWLLKNRKISPVDLVNAHLERVDALDKTLNAFITASREEASAAAKEAELAIAGGNYRGPLHGIPIGLKDLFATTGIRTTSGTKIMADYVPSEDATAVAKLKDAGAIILGKLNMNELALGATGENAHYGDTLNPWNPDRISGGSSGGSGVATAAGECAAALGTDTGGSGRIPAALCGIVGLKPTYGRVSVDGVTTLCWSLDHVSIFTRTVEDCALMLNAIAGYNPLDPASADVPVQDYTKAINDGSRPLRIGVPKEDVWDGVDPEIQAAVRTAIETMAGSDNTSVVDVSIPLLPTCGDLATSLMGAEAITSHGELLKEHASSLDPKMRPRLERGLGVSAVDYINAQKARAALSRQVKIVLEEVDLLAFPTTAIVAPTRGTDEVEIEGIKVPVLGALARLNRLGNLTGLPAVSVPCGFSKQGLPIGLQLVGRLFDEATLLRAANAYEQATDWHKIHPSLQI